MPITISVDNNLQEDFNKEVERELRTRALKAFGEVRLATPVDTGRARNSWLIGYQVSYNSTGSAGIQLLTQSDEPREIHITNGTNYIQFLNDGTSIQAPVKFIEQVFSRYFDSVQVQVSD